MYVLIDYEQSCYFIILLKTSIVEELKAKLQKVMGNRQTLRQFIPSFVCYTTTSHKESTSGLVITRDELIVTAGQIQSLTAVMYNQVQC